MKEYESAVVDTEFVNDRISDLHTIVVVENDLLEDAKIPNESNEHFYERYLKSNSWDIESALEHIQQTIEWRQSEKVTQLGLIANPDTILLGGGGAKVVGSDGNNESIEDGVLNKFPMSYLRNNSYIFRDIAGRPIFWYKIGAMDVAGLLETADLDNLFRYFIWRFERMVQILGDDLGKIIVDDDDDDDDGGPGIGIDKWVVLIDLEGFSMFTHFNRTTLDVVTRLNNLCASYYPETLAKLVVINCPYVFKSAWSVINPLIKPTTQAKITISSCCPNESASSDEDHDLIEYYEASKKLSSSSIAS